MEEGQLDPAITENREMPNAHTQAQSSKSHYGIASIPQLLQQ
jgi:hypothetical protein